MTALHVIDDGLLIIAGGKGDAQQLGGVDVFLTEKLAVAASAVHEVGGQISSELGAGFGDEAREPRDAFDFG
jgi:hypothetical protein